MNIHEKHRQAKAESIKKMAVVKVHSGMYYYKGFFISRDGGNECPWNYGKDELVDYSSAKTYAECKANIDYLTKGKTKEEIINEVVSVFEKTKYVEFIDLCEIMCG